MRPLLTSALWQLVIESRSYRIVNGFIMAVLLIAGVSKVMDPQSFADSLSTWTLIPEFARPFLVVGLPATEVGIALSWFLFDRKRQFALAAIGLLTAFTFLYGLQSYILTPPTCSCFGRWLAYSRTASSLNVVLARNFLLLGLLILCYRRRVPSCKCFNSTSHDAERQ